MADELIDIFDKDNNSTGCQKMKSEAHRLGLWHRTAHVWIYNDHGELLLQKRASNKALWPDVWDISAAGHIGAGETEIIGALREIKEELGLTVEPEDLLLIKIQKGTIIYKDINNCEFYYIFLLKFNGSIKDLKMQSEEVQDIKFISFEDLNKDLVKNPEIYFPHGTYWLEIIDYIKKLMH